MPNIWKSFSQSFCKKLYPTDSRPGLFYGTAKVHNIGKGEGLNKLTMRPIIPNTATANLRNS